MITLRSAEFYFAFSYDNCLPHFPGSYFLWSLFNGSNAPYRKLASFLVRSTDSVTSRSKLTFYPIEEQTHLKSGFI